MDTTVERWLVSPTMDEFEGLTTAALLRRSAIAAPDLPAIICGDMRVSYRELDRAASRCANALIAAGINKGDVVAILSGNRPEYAIAHFGAARAGAVAAHTTLPVIGVPLSGGALDGIDALLATVQMPRGIPVATVAVDGAVNAALLAVQILSVTASALTGALATYREEMASR